MAISVKSKQTPPAHRWSAAAPGPLLPVQRRGEGSVRRRGVRKAVWRGAEPVLSSDRRSDRASHEVSLEEVTIESLIAGLN